MLQHELRATHSEWGIGCDLLRQLTGRVIGSACIGIDIIHQANSLGPLGNDEREHVRRYFVRSQWDVSNDVSLDVRFTRENDDEETFHLLSISLSYDF